jgi:DNA-binding NtrC family response regulator
MPEALKHADVRLGHFGRPPSTAVELVGRSEKVIRVHELVRRAAILDGGVIITAERGTAVESIAREIHDGSRLAHEPWVAIECASHEPAALERALFGKSPVDVPTDLESVAGDSVIAAARGGTLFLGDAVELPAAAQARLARIARDREVRMDRVPVAASIRIIASAPPTIDAEVHAHRFRADLYRRLAAVRIDVPPLRDRSEDVPAIASRLLADICSARGEAPRAFTQAALALIGALSWPGNLAELKTTIERLVSETRETIIQVEDVLPALDLQRARPPFTPVGSLRDARLRFEREYIAAVLQHHGWRMADAAATLGMQRPNLYRKARQLGIPVTRATE